jgi:hypothetical protein
MTQNNDFRKEHFQYLNRITKDNQTRVHEDHNVTERETWVMFIYYGIHVKTITKLFNDTKSSTAYKTNNAS